jgi:hypothetical protein
VALCLQSIVPCNISITKPSTMSVDVCNQYWFVLLQGQREDEVPVQAEGSWQAGAPTDFQPFESTNPRNTSGHHINVVLKPGASQVNCVMFVHWSTQGCSK